MIERIKLFLLMRRIAHLERHEQEVWENLKYIRTKLLPELRNRRNEIMFPVKARGA